MNNLPIGYTLCEYIESNGTQWIDTGFVANQDSRITVDCSFLATSAEQRLFGARTAWAVDEFVLLARSNKYEYRYGNQTVALESSPISDRYIVDADKRTINFNGEVKTAAANNFSTVVPIVLFAYNDNGSVYDFAKARIYSCQMYDNGTLIRDYIPAVSIDGVCGLWDKVENKFYMSANGNNFIGKIDASELPIGYTLCEYIESDGTQYIDTGFKPNQDTRVVMECNTTSSTSTVNRWLFGSNTSSTSARFEVVNIASDNSIRFYHGSTNQTFNGVGLGQMLIDVSLSSASVNDVSITPTASTFTGANTLLIFAGQTTGEVYNGMSMKVYSCQIYNNGMLVRDYVPCQDMYGVYGLYDLANNVFYQSASDYGFTGKWREDKKLLVSPSEFRKRLMMLAVTDKKPDYSKLRGVFIEDIDGCLYTQSEWDGSKIPNGVAVLTDNCRFVVYGYYQQDTLFEYQGSVLYDTYYLPDSYPTFDYGYATTDYNGQSNTDRLCSMEGYYSWSIARECRNTVFPNGQYGYLAAAGEWNELINNYNEVDNALSKAGMRRLGLFSGMYWLTSTCFMKGDPQFTQFWAFNMDYKRTATVNAYSEQYSRPLTKLKFDN